MLMPTALRSFALTRLALFAAMASLALALMSGPCEAAGSVATSHAGMAAGRADHCPPTRPLDRSAHAAAVACLGSCAAPLPGPTATLAPPREAEIVPQPTAGPSPEGRQPDLEAPPPR